MSAIAYFHKLAGVHDTTSHFIIRKIMQGLAKTHASADLRVPITPETLLALVHSAQATATSIYDQHLFPTMFTLMFHGFLRIGEVTESPHNILYHQVAWSANAISLTFKTFKHHTGQPVTLSNPAALMPAACPVLLLSNYVRIQGSRLGPLFCDGSNRPVTQARFQNILRTALAHANLTALHITPHNFRIVAATCAATKGMSTQQIQAIGRWQSLAFQKYIRIT